MATLKDLIKKETMLVAAHSATPGDVSIAIETDKKETASWLDVATFTAPSAGSVEVTARGNGTGTSAIQIAAAIVHTHAWTGTMLNRITIQASKGRTVYVSGQNFKELSVRFIKSIGGGYKRYLKALSRNRFGGLLWLRLKTIYAASESKSSTSGCRTTTRKLFCQTGQKNTRRHQTGLRMSRISFQRQGSLPSTFAHQLGAWYSWQERNRMWKGIRGGIQSISDSLKDNGIALRLQKVPQKNQQLLIADSTLTSANNHYMEVAA